VQHLSAEKAAHSHDQSGLLTRLFHVLFPYGPAANALLATLYISGPPNFLLALCPTDIDPSSLSIMVAFAVGGLMGDTLFHLLPEIFLGEEEHGRVSFVLVEPNRNLLLGLAIMVGFMTFVAMDKGLRIATGGAGHDHGHGHAHAHAHGNGHAHGASSSAVDMGKDNRATSRKNGKGKESGSTHEHRMERDVNPSVKLGGYLNLIADFTHNITDGLAMAASFYASPAVGASTTLAVFMHEIPHEVGDFALLIQSGFSKKKAMGAQFVTATGAFLGTLIGIAIQEFSDGGDEHRPITGGIWGTSLVSIRD
jgi:solute carrier family 39 (zinc transporter), member 7